MTSMEPGRPMAFSRNGQVAALLPTRETTLATMKIWTLPAGTVR